MYHLYGAVKSRALRVLWMLEEIGADYEFTQAGPQSQTVREVSALGKIPVLVTEGQAIPDSLAILTFLADKHGALTFPAGTLARARQDAWTFRILDELEAQLWTAAKHSFVLPEAERLPEVKPSAMAEYARNLDRICAEMEGPFLMGEHFTIADILLTHCAGWARGTGFPDGPDSFAPYLKAARARPAFTAALARG